MDDLLEYVPLLVVVLGALALLGMVWLMGAGAYREQEVELRAGRG